MYVMGSVVKISVHTMLTTVRTFGICHKTFTRAFSILRSSSCKIRPVFAYKENLFKYPAGLRLCSNVPLDKHCKQPITHPTKGKLIYAGQLNKKVKICKTLSLTTCTLGVAGQIYLCLNAATLPTSILLMGSSSLAFFMFISTGLIQFITMRYLTDIYYNPETGIFTAGRITFFLQRKEIEYTVDDVQVPEIQGPLSNMKIKGKPYVAFDVFFKDYDAYIHMVGYDKPLDLKTSTKSEKED